MSALETLANICNTKLINADNLRFCLVSSDKKPYKIDDTLARPNHIEDFVPIEMLIRHELNTYAGIGISIQASKIFAIDIDHCFSKAFDVSSADKRATDILKRFEKYAYCEFSFSGTGLRILFKENIIANYTLTYYIKNESCGIEFYQPTSSFRYVTVTGKAIADNDICEYKTELSSIVKKFLDDYMLRPIQKSYKIKTSIEETRSFEELLKLTKVLYFKNSTFQNLWFSQAPGSGKDESERDYHILSLLYENITQDKNMIKQLFETSPYFKSKDSKHIFKWTYQEGRYYNYVYDMIRRSKQ